MVAVGLFSQNVEAVIFGDARALLGGDIEAALRASPPPWANTGYANANPGTPMRPWSEGARETPSTAASAAP